jgi:hypothetical protein
MSNVKIVSFEVYPDASGAPAVVSCGAYTFAFDCLGEVKQNSIRQVYGMRKESRIAAARCLSAYNRELSARVDAAWRQKNSELYSK